jgi:ADP-ribose pyrophosphatase YjhB (NUDIX family)
VEIPAGMVDSSGSFSGKAADEIKEETGLEVRENELLDMTKLALQDVQPDFPSATVSLQDAMYPSPGACDESITLFLCQKRLTRRNLQNLEGKMTGLEKEGEKIRLKLVPLNRLWKDAARDGKALAALSLYDNLKGEGKIPDMPKKAEQKPKDLHAESSE